MQTKQEKLVIEIQNKIQQQQKEIKELYSTENKFNFLTSTNIKRLRAIGCDTIKGKVTYALKLLDIPDDDEGSCALKLKLALKSKPKEKDIKCFLTKAKQFTSKINALTITETNFLDKLAELAPKKLQEELDKNLKILEKIKAKIEKEKLLKERIAFEWDAVKNKKRFFYVKNTITIANNLFADVLSDHISQILDFYDMAVSAGDNQIARSGFWSKILGTKGQVNSGKKHENNASNSKAFVVGADYRIINNILVGSFLGKNLANVYYDNIKSNNNGAYDSINSTLKGLYGSFNFKPELNIDVIYINNNSTLKSLNEDGNQIGKSTDIIGSTFVNAKIRYNLQLTDIFQIIPTFGYKYNQINPFEFKNSASRSNTVKAMSTHSLFLGASAISNYLLDDAELINEIHILGDFTVIKPENTNISSACIANIHLSLNETLTDWNVGNSLNIGASSKIICNNFVSGIGLDWKTSSNYTGFSGNISMRLEV